MAIRSYKSVREFEHFQCECLKHTFTCVYIDFSMEVAA